MDDRTSPYKIIPYLQYDGSWSIPDSYVKKCWRKMCEKNLQKAVFYSGEVRDEESFLKCMKAEGNHPFFVFLDKEIACISWLNGVRHNSAVGHFCGFPCVWGKRAKEIGEELFKIWLGHKKEDGSFLFDVIIGQTPSSNRLAVRFLKQLGLKVIGEIPHIAKDNYRNITGSMVISYREREV